MFFCLVNFFFFLAFVIIRSEPLKLLIILSNSLFVFSQYGFQFASVNTNFSFCVVASCTVF